MFFKFICCLNVRLLSADGTVIDIDRTYQNLTVNSHGKINTIKASMDEFFRFPFRFFTEKQWKLFHASSQSQTPATESYAQISADPETMNTALPDQIPDICDADLDGGNKIFSNIIDF